MMTLNELKHLADGIDPERYGCRVKIRPRKMRLDVTITAGRNVWAVARSLICEELKPCNVDEAKGTFHLVPRD